jgi:toxin ParE1/3/4
MTLKVKFTTLARQDLRHLQTYIAQHNPIAARRLRTRIEEACAHLAAMPATGQARPELSPSLRCFPVNPYTIYYRVMPDNVQIVRVIHQARHIERITFPVH